MTEWWTYGLSDFLMFSPQAYWRLVARYNEAWWPQQVVGAVVPLALAALVRVPAAGAARAALLLLAAAWAWVAGAFAWDRYAEIFLAAGWLAASYAAQSALLLLAAGLPMRAARNAAGRVAWPWLAAALLYPLLAPLTGHAWREAEVFGFMPEPTALGTIGVVAARGGRLRLVLAVVPVLALLLGAATRWLLAR